MIKTHTEWVMVKVNQEPPPGSEVQVQNSAGEWKDPVSPAFYIQKEQHQPRRWRRKLNVEERLTQLENVLTQLEEANGQ